MIDRTTTFAADIVKFCRPLFQRHECYKIAGQLLDAGTSVASNYRAACRGRSRAEFIAKLGIANEESDESVFWLWTLQKSGLESSPELERLLQEATELRAILARSRATALANDEKRKAEERRVRQKQARR